MYTYDARIYIYICKNTYSCLHTHTHILYICTLHIYISHPPKDLPFLAFVDAKQGWEPFAKTK